MKEGAEQHCPRVLREIKQALETEKYMVHSNESEEDTTATALGLDRQTLNQLVDTQLLEEISPPGQEMQKLETEVQTATSVLKQRGPVRHHQRGSGPDQQASDELPAVVSRGGRSVPRPSAPGVSSSRSTFLSHSAQLTCTMWKRCSAFFL